MIIESIVAASTILNQINQMVATANETGQGIQNVMGLISDFGEGLNEFEAKRRKSTFKPLSNDELLKLQMLKRQYERHWKSVHDLLAMLDPELLHQFQEAKAQQERDRKAHLEMLRKKRKEREEFIEATLVISLVVALGGGILFMALWLIL
jgi:hypothetical protein|tara:strand:+ start:22 stop:474 length:453 start_codon:yes stop_codon:yes gene_type:complete